MNSNTTKLKYTVLAIVIMVVGIVAYFIYQTVYRSDKVQVNVSTLPSDAKVTIDKQVVGNGNTYITPGDHTVLIEKSGFTTYSEKVTYTKPTGVIDMGLTPESTDAKAWATQHASEYTSFEGRAGARAQKNGQDFATINPVVKNLPFKNFLFTIGYFVDPTDASGNSIIVTINAPEGYRQAAINKLVEWGINPAEQNIIFVGYNNQFAS